MIIKNFAFKKCKFTLVYQGCSFVVIDAYDGVTCLLYGCILPSSSIFIGTTCGLCYMPYTAQELADKVDKMLYSLGICGEQSHNWRFTERLFIPSFELSEFTKDLCGL